MYQPTLLEYIIISAVSLVFATIGLYLLANFGRILRGKIKNEILRKNAAAWFVIFFLSSAVSPLSGTIYITIAKYGLLGSVLWQIGATTVSTVIVFNSARYVAENKKLMSLSFVKHKLLVLATLVITLLVINIPATYCLFGGQLKYFKYGIISSIYSSITIALVYTATSYLNLLQKKKFDEKELELSRLRELKTKAELDALHSKINPHFLYNALNSIADLSITDGKKGRKMTIALADLFRYSINYSNNNYSTVKDEVEMANVYLQIEKIRFEDKLNYTLTVEDELNHFLVPRFVLQPLVENAVKHGLKATGQLTEIKLEVKRDTNGLVIDVADTGPAFPDELVPGYGVKSVFDKLDLLFPGNYEMHFSNQPVKQVSLHIHKLMKDEPGI